MEPAVGVEAGVEAGVDVAAVVAAPAGGLKADGRLTRLTDGRWTVSGL